MLRRVSRPCGAALRLAPGRAGRAVGGAGPWAGGAGRCHGARTHMRQDKVERMSCRVLAPSPSGRGRGVRELAAWRTPLKLLTLALSQRERGQKVRFV